MNFIVIIKKLSFDFAEPGKERKYLFLLEHFYSSSLEGFTVSNLLLFGSEKLIRKGFIDQ